jgi:hypothetical protein
MSDDTADLIARARAAVRSGARNHDLLTALADALEAAEQETEEDIGVIKLLRRQRDEAEFRVRELEVACSTLIADLIARAERAEADRDRLLAAIGDADVVKRMVSACCNFQVQMAPKDPTWFDWVPDHLRAASLMRSMRCSGILEQLPRGGPAEGTKP